MQCEIYIIVQISDFMLVLSSWISHGIPSHLAFNRFMVSFEEHLRTLSCRTAEVLLTFAKAQFRGAPVVAGPGAPQDCGNALLAASPEAAKTETQWICYLQVI